MNMVNATNKVRKLQLHTRLEGRGLYNCTLDWRLLVVILVVFYSTKDY